MRVVEQGARRVAAGKVQVGRFLAYVELLNIGKRKPGISQGKMPVQVQSLLVLLNGLFQSRMVRFIHQLFGFTVCLEYICGHASQFLGIA